jgi:signal peptidase I
VTRARKPWLAAVLSLLAAGTGHLYAGYPLLGLKRFVFTFVAGLAAIALSLAVPLGPATLLPALVVIALIVWVAIDAARYARAAPADYEPRRYNRWYVYAGAIILVGLLRMLPLNFVETYRQSSEAMEPSLMRNEMFYAVKGPLLRGRPLGRILVFESPEPGVGNIAKRVVGVPGDTLRMQDGIFFRNGVAAPEQYKPGQRTEYWGPVVVPRDSFFMLGDNRTASRDSRYFGFVGRDRIRGGAHLLYYSYDTEGDMPLPFLTAIRWDRIGMRIR